MESVEVKPLESRPYGALATGIDPTAANDSAKSPEVWTWWQILLLCLVAIGWLLLMEFCITNADVWLAWLGVDRDPQTTAMYLLVASARMLTRALIRVIQGLGLFFILALPLKSWDYPGKEWLLKKLPAYCKQFLPAYHTAFQLVVKATFPNDEEPKPGGFGTWADLRKWATWFGYYSGVLSLSATRRLLYVAVQPIHSNSRREHSFFLRPKRIVEKLRVYIETELFAEKQRAGESNADYGERIAEEYLKNLSTYDSGRDPVLHCQTCFDIFGDNNEPIRNYFQAQEELQDDLGKTPPGFLSKIRFETGYLAPAYLVSGPLDEFNEDWTKIVQAYHQKMVELTKQDPLKKLDDLRKLQSFIWDCWVQWGPSVPICKHDDWKDGAVALQFGYGDENNSLPLIFRPPVPSPADGQGGSTLSDWAGPASTLKKLDRGLGWAWPVKVTGRLQWYRLKDRNDKYCKAQHNKNPQADEEGWLAFEAESIEPDNAPLYYSAYVWVLIAICCSTKHNPFADPDDEAANAKHSERGYRLIHSRKADEWRCLIPFFQHGNIAEASVFDDIKRELAYKTIDSLVEQLKRAQDAGIDWLHFAFVAAYDDNGDSGASDLLVDPPGKSIATWLKQAYDERRPKPDPNRDAGNTDLFDFIHIQPDALDDLTAADLPNVVRTYLDQIK